MNAENPRFTTQEATWFLNQVRGMTIDGICVTEMIKAYRRTECDNEDSLLGKWLQNCSGAAQPRVGAYLAIARENRRPTTLCS